LETLTALAQGFVVAVQPYHLWLALIGCLVGTLVGALPGLGPVNGVAILIPVAFSVGLTPVAAMILLASVYYGTMYGGRISSIMLNIPGDEPAMMTTLDGYPMAQSGRAASALAISAVASFIGATVATIGLTLFAPLLADVAIHFGPAEYFALFVLAFLTIGGITGSNPAKSLLAAAIGLVLGTVGLDPATGVARYTFDHYKLYDGIDFMVAIVGLFALSEFLLFLERPPSLRESRIRVGTYKKALADVAKTFGAMGRSSLVGFVSGVLPGAGASLGSFLSYVFEKRISDTQGTFGKGDPRGVAAPEAGNNAAAGGALVPMLTLGIPGSGTTAVLLALLLSLNITPGPMLFQDQPDLVWGLIAALYLGNVMLLVLNLPLIGLFTRVLMLPYWVLMPLVVIVGFMGVYSINNSAFDLLLMTGFGVFGYILRKLAISLVPVVLGLLLGSEMEFSLRRALSISDGDWSILVASPIAVGIYIFAGLLFAVAIGFAVKRAERWWSGRSPGHGG
jgi:putative tricarboxylic transport membrane protein